tara:strand:- start:481 stop:693 length:213 start_codon:yes stop_codon:yes gene_type:complete
MTYNEQTDALQAEISNLLRRYVEEFDLNVPTIIGVLEEAKIDLVQDGTIFMSLDDDFLELDDEDGLLDDE